MGTNAESYFGRGMKLDGINQCVITDTKITDPNNCTISVYIYDIGSVTGKVIYSGHNLSIDASEAGKVKINYSNGSRWVNEYASFTPGQYTVTVTNGQLKLYINKVVVLDIATGGITTNANPVAVGCRVQSYEHSGATIGAALALDYPLTPAQIQYQYEYPETFLYREDGVLKSKILNQDEIDNVKVFMPMMMYDKFECNLADYSENSNISEGGFSVVVNLDETSTYTSNGDSAFDLSVTAVGTSNSHPYVSKLANLSDSSKKYKISFDVIVNSGNPVLRGLYNGNYMLIDETLFNGHYEYILDKGNDAYDYIVLYFDGTNLFDISVTNYKSVEISGIFEITNYTSSVRDAAKNLPRGLQTAKWKRNTLGIPYALSKGLVCSRDGYLQTDNYVMPRARTIEFILNIKNIYDYQAIATEKMADGSGSYGMTCFTNGSLYYYIRYNNNSYFHAPLYYNTVKNTPFHMIVCIDDSSDEYVEKIIYVNGNLAFSEKLPFTYRTDEIMTSIGGGFRAQRANEDYEILDFKIFPKTMLPQEVKYRYNKAVSAGLLDQGELK